MNQIFQIESEAFYYCVSLSHIELPTINLYYIAETLIWIFTRFIQKSFTLLSLTF